MHELITYYKGADIVFEAQGNDELNLSEIDFKILFWIDRQAPTVVEKSAGKIVRNNTYQFTIPAATTKEMQAGLYNIEFLKIENELQDICLKEMAFRLKNSASELL